MSAPAPTQKKVSDWGRECKRILKFLKEQPDAGPFLQPVDWKAWGLDDYPTIVKQPMDLSKVEKKLEDSEYTSIVDFNKDVNLIWSNCMLYNQDDSEYYKQAQKMKKLFLDKMSVVFDLADAADETRIPTQAEKKFFSQGIYVISPEELGKVVKVLDEKCPTCIRKIDADDIEIDIDAIDASTFWVVDKYVKDCSQPGGSSAKALNKKRPRDDPAAVAAPSMASGKK